jgi:hypothetical protein
MPCFYPVDAWRAQCLNDNGKRPLVFSRRSGFADMHLQVPCGRCVGCRGDQAQSWAIRCWCEAALHERNSFLTLTYADPAPPVISKADVQAFIKRLRKFYKFRYFLTGEYGEHSRRPHYHALIFGQDFLEGSIPSDTGETYSNPLVEAEWSHGSVVIGSVTMSSACYVAGYVQKKAGDADTFSLKSNRPGLGFDWLSRFYDDIVRNNSITIDGKSLPVPKRFLEKFSAELSDVKTVRLLEAKRAKRVDLNRSLLFRRNRELNKKSALLLRSEDV